MNDEKKNGMLDPTITDGVELSDEILDQVAGGYIYHDAGDPATHRKEAFYVLDRNGTIVMKLEDMAKAKHWAGNLRTSLRSLSTDEFEKMRHS